MILHAPRNKTKGSTSLMPVRRIVEREYGIVKKHHHGVRGCRNLVFRNHLGRDFSHTPRSVRSDLEDDMGRAFVKGVQKASRGPHPGPVTSARPPSRPSKIRRAAGPPSASKSSSSTGFPSRISTHPLTTSVRPRRAHSPSMLCLGVVPHCEVTRQSLHECRLVIARRPTSVDETLDEVSSPITQ